MSRPLAKRIAPIVLVSTDLLHTTPDSEIRPMNSYPALLDLATLKQHPLGASESFVVGRNETADLCVLDSACSRQHFRLVRRDGRYFVERLNVANPTFHNRK